MDEAIFQEFKGTGNLEIVLDPVLADHRVWPAMDIVASRTRREELLLTAGELHSATAIRRALSGMSPLEAMQRLTTQLGRFETNAALVEVVRSAASHPADSR